MRQQEKKYTRNYFTPGDIICYFSPSHFLPTQPDRQTKIVKKENLDNQTHWPKSEKWEPNINFKKQSSRGMIINSIQQPAQPDLKEISQNNKQWAKYSKAIFGLKIGQVDAGMHDHGN